jgi:hypothetical protein
MATEFVRYAPDVEADDPHFEENLQASVAITEQYVTESLKAEGMGLAVRAAHAKGYGLVKAEVEILGELPAEYAQGIYATPGRHDALIRFSNGSAHLGTDARLSSPVGIGLKMFDIDGPTLLEDEPDTRTFDYVNIDAPVFFANTIEHYAQFIQHLGIYAGSYFAEGEAGAHRFFRDFVTGMGTLDEDNWAWDELLAFVRVVAQPRRNLLLSSYWTMGAVRHGDYLAKVRVAPVGAFAHKVVERDLDPTKAPEVFRPSLIAELRDRPYEFDIQVQLCTDLERMPIEDVTVEWPETLSSPLTVAKVRIPRQDISGDENLEELDALSFSPWRVTAEHRPLGNIMRARKEVYRHSSILRHKINNQERQEPRSADEVLAPP